MVAIHVNTSSVWKHIHSFYISNRIEGLTCCVPSLSPVAPKTSSARSLDLTAAMTVRPDMMS